MSKIVNIFLKRSCRNGFSLIELIIVMGITSIVVSGLASIFVLGTHGTRTVQKNAAYNSLIGLLRKSLDNPASCRNSFGGQTPGNGVHVVVQFYGGAGGTIDDFAHNHFNNGEITIQSLTFNNVLPVGTGNAAIATLDLVADLRGLDGQAYMTRQIQQQSFNVSFSLDANGKITNCSAKPGHTYTAHTNSAVGASSLNAPCALGDFALNGGAVADIPWHTVASFPAPIAATDPVGTPAPGWSCVGNLVVDCYAICRSP